MKKYIKKHLIETIKIIEKIDSDKIEEIANNLKKLKNSNGRLFILGVGGSAANASHAVNDFRKICNIESYAPTDNVSELTALTNDVGWDYVFSEWLKESNLKKNDLILVFSVGGGSIKNNVSVNLVNAIKFSKKRGCKVLSIVGKNNGYAAKNSDVACVIPTVNKSNITPHTEAFQGVVWHALVSHPELKKNKTKWEEIKK